MVPASNNNNHNQNNHVEMTSTNSRTTSKIVLCAPKVVVSSDLVVLFEATIVPISKDFLEPWQKSKAKKGDPMRTAKRGGSAKE